MCAESQYCSYRHYAADLERADPKCVIAMFTAYFDDSGTDRNSEIAIAACYVSTKRGWDDFVKRGMTPDGKRDSKPFTWPTS